MNDPTSPEAARDPLDQAADEAEPIPPPPDVKLPLDIEQAAPLFHQLYARPQLAEDRRRELISLARLPSWPVPEGEPEPAYGHGWGPTLDGMLSGGLRPGEMIGLGASAAGSGKTAWAMQVIDGLSLRNDRVLRGEDAWGSALTPVLVASEMSIAALTWRSLARWTGCSSSYFRGGRSLARKRPIEAEKAWNAADAALEGELGGARRWMRLLDASRASLATAAGAKALVEDIKAIVSTWREQLGRAHPQREVVPIVLVDPLQRYQSGRDEVADLNALARELCAATLSESWITLLTSDTNKASARGERGDVGTSDAEEGAGVFRGSYGLIHELSAALYLRRPRQLLLSEDEEREGTRYVETVFVKARWGGGIPPWPRFRWHGPTTRFWPMSKEATEKHDALLAERRATEDERRLEAKRRKSGSAPGAPRADYEG